MKNKINYKVVIAGIAGLTIIEVCALFNGIDGYLLSAIVGLIGVAIGVTLPNPVKE